MGVRPTWASASERYLLSEERSDSLAWPNGEVTKKRVQKIKS